MGKNRLKSLTTITVSQTSVTGLLNTIFDKNFQINTCFLLKSIVQYTSKQKYTLYLASRLNTLSYAQFKEINKIGGVNYDKGKKTRNH